KIRHFPNDFTLNTLLTYCSKTSNPKPRFPYTFFEPGLQGMIHGGATVGDKPVGYQELTIISGEGSGTN
ncbi:MAG: hypothetical protein AAF528_02355, partial [Cyanobacteria bacterium P01_C01_bin.121]